MGTAEGAAKAREARMKRKLLTADVNTDNKNDQSEKVLTSKLTTLKSAQVPEAEAKPKPVRSTPWNPKSLLSHPPMPGYRLRWVAKSQLKKRLLEGWEVVNNSKSGRPVTDGGDILERSGIDGTKFDSTTQLRELILCRMPEELARAREAYYREQSASLLESSEKQAKRDGLYKTE